MRKHTVLRSICLDVLLAGAALTVFALFHHVLPRQQQSAGIVIPNPYAETVQAAQEEARDAAAEVPEAQETQPLLASAGSSPAGGRNSRRSGARSGSRSSRTSQKGGSSLAEEAGAGETGGTPIGEKFAGQFTEETVRTANSYTSPDLSVTVTEETLDGGRITYYIADICTRDVTTLQTALAGGTYGSGYRAEIADMAEASGALLAVNGDYYGNTSEGVVIRNGVIYRANPTDCDVCVLYYDGSMRVMPGSSFSAEEAVAEGAWQAWTFGPSLLSAEGEAIDTFSSSRMIARANPRTSIGCYEPGHYCLVVVDGRGDSEGMTLAELSRLFADLGCQTAYNLDGGNSSVMVWNGEVINRPSGGGRASSDALLIAEVD